MGAGDDHRGAVVDLQGQLAGTRNELGAVGQRPREDRAEEVRGSRFRDALGSPHALDLRGDHRQQQPLHRGARLGLGAHVQGADGRVGDAQRHAVDAVAATQQGPLLGRRAGGHRERRPPRVGHGEARLQGPGGGADHLGQPRARLDRLGDRVERVEVRHG